MLVGRDGLAIWNTEHRPWADVLFGLTATDFSIFIMV